MPALITGSTILRRVFREWLLKTCLSPHEPLVFCNFMLIYLGISKR
jgi:hypothetical protein